MGFVNYSFTPVLDQSRGNPPPHLLIYCWRLERAGQALPASRVDSPCAGFLEWLTLPCRVTSQEWRSEVDRLSWSPGGVSCEVTAGPSVLSCRSLLGEQALSTSCASGSVLNAGKPEVRRAPLGAQSDDRDERGHTV